MSSRENWSEEPAPASSRIAIHRNSPDDVRTRQIVVSLDGERKGELLFGESLTLPAAPGRHTLLVDNTWNRKELEVELAGGAELSFVVKSTAGQFSRFLLVAFGAGPIYVSIEPAPAAAQT